MTYISNQVSSVVNHPPICSNDQEAFGYVLHPRRVEGAVKPFWGRYGLVKRVVRQ